MSIGIITLIVILSLLVLIVTGFPVAFSLLAIAVAGIIIWISPEALTALASIVLSSTTTDYFIALPMFIFMASILQVSGIGHALYEAMYKWMAGLKGGLAMGTVLISTVIAGMSGAAATSTVSMGLLAYPQMRDRGYSKKISIGCVSAGGCLGPLIPPSIPMIIVAALGSLSIGKLFMAGVFPGLLTSFFFIMYIGIRSFRNPTLGPPIPVSDRANWKEKIAILRQVLVPLTLVIMVIGAIYTGICTPSEAGGVGAFGALICAALYRNLNWKNMKIALLTSLKLNAMVFWLIIGGSCFSAMLGLTGVKNFISEILIGVGINHWTTLILMLSIVYLMGMVMDATAIAIICIPIFMPIVREIGFDPLWFGLIFTMDMIIGYITPPFGIDAFYFKGLGHPEVNMLDIYRSVFPFVIIITIAWVLCIVFPAVSMWLPSTMIK